MNKFGASIFNVTCNLYNVSEKQTVECFNALPGHLVCKFMSLVIHSIIHLIRGYVGVTVGLQLF